MMKLTDKELLLIRNTLYARKMYAPYGDIVWKPFMQSLLQKIEDELIDSPPYTKHEQVLT